MHEGKRRATVSPARTIEFHSINVNSSSTNEEDRREVNPMTSPKRHYHVGSSVNGVEEEVDVSLDDVGPNVRVQLDSDRRDYAPGKGNRYGATFNVVNTIVGAGIIGLPFAMKQCGLLAGIVLICVAAHLCRKSNILLVETGELVGRLNYEELMEALYGSAGFYGFCFFSFVMSFGAMAAYLIILGDTIPEIVQQGGGDGVWTDRNSVIAICSICFVLPVASFRGLHHLAFTSFISVMADVLMVIIIIAAGPSAADEEYDDDAINKGNTFSVIKPTVFAGFGAISFAFVSQSSTFLIYRSLKSRSQDTWTGVVNVAMAIAWVMGLVFALSGYLIFVNQTEGDILNNFPTNSKPASVARGFLAVTMILTYPMEMFVARHVIDASICQRVFQMGEMNTFRHCSWTFAIWTCTVLVALSTDDLGAVLEIFGAFAASALGYVMPAMMHLQANRRKISEDLQVWRKDSECYRPRLTDRIRACSHWYGTVWMFLFGMVALIAGSISAMVGT